MTTKKKTQSQLYEIYRGICRGMDHEATVMNNRIMWAILYSGGLFTATALLVNAIVSVDTNDAAEDYVFFVMSLISITGVLFSLVSWRGVAAAQRQAEELRGIWRRYKGELGDPEADEGATDLGLPRPFGDDGAHKDGNAAAEMFPIMMLVTWGAAAIIEFLLIFL